MPDNSLPSSTPNSQVAPDELNLVEPAVDKPRLKRRNLKGRANTVATARPAERATDEPAPLPDSPRPDYPKPDAPREEAAAKSSTAIPAAKPAAGNPFTSSPPISAQSLPTTPLYYTNGPRKEKEDAPPMKTPSAPTPAAASSASPVAASATTRPATASAAPTQARPATTNTNATSAAPALNRTATSSPASSFQQRPAATASSSSSTPSSSASRPASGTTTPPRSSTAGPSPTSTYASTPTVASPSRSGGSVNDYRANVERQSREQKSVGGVISMVVYALVGLFILGSLLAVYGTYTITKQIHQQSVTMSDLDSRYSAQNQALTAQLKASNDSLTQALTQTQAQLKRQQDLITRQQDAMAKLVTAGDANTAAWRQERQARAAETAALRTRLRAMEDQPRLGPNR